MFKAAFALGVWAVECLYMFGGTAALMHTAVHVYIYIYIYMYCSYI